MVSSKIMEVSQKHCLRSSIESFTSSSPSEQIIGRHSYYSVEQDKMSDYYFMLFAWV